MIVIVSTHLFLSRAKIRNQCYNRFKHIFHLCYKRNKAKKRGLSLNYAQINVSL